MNIRTYCCSHCTRCPDIASIFAFSVWSKVILCMHNSQQYFFIISDNIEMMLVTSLKFLTVLDSHAQTLGLHSLMYPVC